MYTLPIPKKLCDQWCIQTNDFDHLVQMSRLVVDTMVQWSVLTLADKTARVDMLYHHLQYASANREVYESIQKDYAWVFQLTKVRSLTGMIETGQALLAQLMHAEVVYKGQCAVDTTHIKRWGLWQTHCWSDYFDMPFPQDIGDPPRQFSVVKWLIKRVIGRDLFGRYCVISEQSRQGYIQANKDELPMIHHETMHILKEMQWRLHILQWVFWIDILDLFQWAKQFKHHIQDQMMEVNGLYESCHKQVKITKAHSVVDTHKLEVSPWPSVIEDMHLQYSWPRRQLIAIIAKNNFSDEWHVSQLWLYKLIHFYHRQFIEKNPSIQDVEIMKNGIENLISEDDREKLETWVVYSDVKLMQCWVSREINNPNFSAQLHVIIQPKLDVYTVLCPWLKDDWSALALHAATLKDTQLQLSLNTQSSRTVMLQEKYGWADKFYMQYCQKEYAPVTSAGQVSALRTFGVWAVAEPLMTDKKALKPVAKLKGGLPLDKALLHLPQVSEGLKDIYQTLLMRS